ncbi:MAG TPA: TA system VapC family ribonuclease toxin [Terriglobales bacterium]
MIAIDTNILVYAHRRDSQWHAAARQALAAVAGRRRFWALPWPCVHEFFSIVTHPRIFTPPSTPAEAIAEIEGWLESPTLRLLSESAAHWGELKAVLLAGQLRGPAVHYARIAALCREHDVDVLWTADRDFSRMAGLRVHNPLLQG